MSQSRKVFAAVTWQRTFGSWSRVARPWPGRRSDPFLQGDEALVAGRQGSGRDHLVGDRPLVAMRSRRSRAWEPETQAKVMSGRSELVNPS